MLLRHSEKGENRLFAGINPTIRRGTTAYEALLHRLSRWKFAVIAVFFIGLAATWFVYQRVPSSFVPEEDQGYFFVLVQAPPGASIQYTTRVLDEATAILQKNSDIQGMFSVPGFSQAGSAPNKGVIFASLKDISQRTGKGHSAAEYRQRPARAAFGDFRCVRDSFCAAGH